VNATVPVDIVAVQLEARHNLDILREVVMEHFSDENNVEALICIIAVQLGMIFQTVDRTEHRPTAEDINRVLDRMPGVPYRLQPIPGVTIP